MRMLALAGAVLVLNTGTVAARPYAIDDLLRTEGVGAVGFDPAGRWLAVERRGPLDSAPTFDGAERSQRLATDLVVMDGASPAPRPQLVRRPADGGLIAGPFSPDGAFLAVIQVSARDAGLGILRLGEVQPEWRPETPNWTMHGQALAWRDGRRLLAIVRNAPGLPPGFRSDAEAARIAGRLGDVAGRGAASVTVNGSGRWTPAASAPASLVSIDVVTGARAVLTQGDFEDMELSSSGRYVALLTRRGDRPPRPGEPFRGGETLVRHALRLVDLDTGKVIDLCEGEDLGLLMLRWSPARDDLLIMASPTANETAPRLLRVVAATGQVTPVMPADLRLVPMTSLLVPTIGALWLGGEPAIYAAYADSRRPDWYLLAADGPRNLTAAWPEPPPLVVATTDDGLLFGAGEGVLAFVDRAGRRRDVAGRLPTPLLGSGARRRLDPPHLRLSDLAQPSPVATEVERLAQGPRSALFSVPAAAGAQLELRRLGDAVPVAQLNTHLSGVEIALPEPIVEPSDGRALTHWLYRPKSSGPAALIVIPYPGAVYPTPPQAGRADVLSAMTSIQVLVGAGYAVLVPSLPPLDGPADPTAITAQADRAVSAAIASGNIDPERLAVWGHSFGGYAALAIATRSDRYRAIVAASSASDIGAAWGRFSPAQASAPRPGLSLPGAGWAEYGQAGMAVPPWSAPADYIKASPFYAADRITAPVLLLHGEADTLPAGQAEAMFTALQRQGKDAELAIYFGEGHVFGSPGNLRDLYARAIAFLNRALQSPAGPASDVARAPTTTH